MGHKGMVSLKTKPGMQLYIVKEPDDRWMTFIRELYTTSFPERERRHWEQLITLLGEPSMELALVQNEERKPIGLVIWWLLSGWHYVEHIAIDPLQRGKQYGGKVMQYLVEMSGNRLILEVERAHDNDSERRIRFYERLGLQVLDHDYQQPPYRKSEASLPMWLMSIPAITHRLEMTRMAEKIRHQVYERFY